MQHNQSAQCDKMRAHLEPEPLVVPVDVACRMLSIKRTKCFHYISEGHLQSVMLGGSRMVRVESIKHLATHGAPAMAVAKQDLAA